MLRTNLATRPFYNQRALRAAIAAVALAALALSVYNASRIVSLGARNNDLAARAAAGEARARELGGESRSIREALDRANIGATESAATEANRLIDSRTFSWTALFNSFEATLPGDVRITAVQPQVDRDGQFVLTVGVVSRSLEALDTFITALEATGAFRTTLAVQEQLQEDNTFRSIIRTRYTPSAAAPPAPAAPPDGQAAAAPRSAAEGEGR